MTPRLLGLARMLATLGVLGLLVVFAVTKGLDAVTQPFPEKADPPVCVDNEVDQGDVLRPGGITISVVNAGTRNGQARSVLGDLAEAGFDEGKVANQRDDEIRTVQIWSPGGPSAAVRLVRSYLGGKVEVVDREGTNAGITVVVGDDFAGVKTGRAELDVPTAQTVCGPASLG